MASTTGRRVVVPLANKSGAGVIAGDVVVIDTANDDAFTTTTTAGFTGAVGIAQETIANNATGLVLLSGEAALVNVNASVTRGNFGTTHTVAKQATDAGAARTIGVFCQFKTGGTTPKAILWGFPDATSAAGSIATDGFWDAKGDLAAGTGANTAARLAVAANGSSLRAASGASTGLEWQLNNLAAAAAPTVNEDSGDGYSVGSRWIDTTNDKEYVCLDATVGAAVWTETTMISPWTADLNESGASLANWTQESGSWSVVSSSFQVTTGAGGTDRLKFTAQKRQAVLAFQAQVSMVTGGGFSGQRWLGLLWGWDGSGTGGTFVGLRSEAGSPSSDGTIFGENQQGVSAIPTRPAYLFNFDTFYTLTIISAGSGLWDTYINGVYQTTFGAGTSDVNTAYLGLVVKNCIAQFKNIKTSYLAPTLPL